MADFVKGVRLAGIAFAALFTVWFLIPHWPEPAFDAASVSCFPMPDVSGRVPAVKSELMKLDGAPTEAEHQRSVMQTHQASVRAAEENCTPASCTPDALKKYRSAISFYVFVRENVTRKLYSEHGAGGLDYAAEIFNTSADIDIVDNLRALVAAGTLDLATLGKSKHSAALLVYKTDREYVPCVRSGMRQAATAANPAG